LIKPEVGAREKVLISLDPDSRLLDARELELEGEPTRKGCASGTTALPIADCVIGAHRRRPGCRATATFDARAVKLPGFVARHAAARSILAAVV